MGHQNGEVSAALGEQLDAIRDVVCPESQTVSFLDCSPDPSFILHISSGVFIQVNEAFQSLFDYREPQLLNGTIRAPNLLSSRHRYLLERAQRNPSSISNRTFSICCQSRNGYHFPARVSARIRSIQGEEIMYGSVVDISECHAVEESLQKKHRVIKRANKCFRKIMDKLIQISEVTSDMLKKRHVVGVLTAAESQLCEETGMNFEEVSFFLLNESETRLERPFSVNPDDYISMDASHPAVEVVSGEADTRLYGDNELIVPLQGRGGRMGVVSLTLDPKERALMKEVDLFWEKYCNTLSILTNLIGLIVQNCRMTREERRATIYDALTGVYNRRLFDRKLNQELHRVRRFKSNLSLMIIDVDNFKEINDRYGHQEGDRLLKQIAQKCQDNIRSPDILCRYGGDEFAVLLPITDGKAAEKNARRIVDEVRRTTFTARTDEKSVQEISVQISIGISVLQCRDQKQTEKSAKQMQKKLLKQADRCMFRAKASDGDQVKRYRSSI